MYRGAEYSCGGDCHSTLVRSYSIYIPEKWSEEMCCREADKIGPIIAGKWGGEIVIRCPSCGAIIIMDSTPSAPENIPTQPELIPEIFPAELMGQWGQIKFTN